MNISCPLSRFEISTFSQESPQSNAIHIGHNNPVGSDIKIKQTKPYNTSVHVSLNVGSGSKVIGWNIDRGVLTSLFGFSFFSISKY